MIVTTAKRTPRMHFIDGLRAIAMLAVLLYHAHLYAGLSDLNVSISSHTVDISGVLEYGRYGVSLFLLLSGFCLYWPFVKGGQRSEPTLAEYAYRRCKRILPPYYVALLIFGGLGMVQALTHFQIYHRIVDMHFIWVWFALHALMIQNLSVTHVLALDAPLWSLALEFQLYICFPIIVEAYRRWNKRVVLMLVLVLCSVYRACIPPTAIADDPMNLFVLSYSVFGRCFEFALGMYVADMVSKWPQHEKSPLRIWDVMFGAMVVVAAFWRLDVFNDAAIGVAFATLVLVASRVANPLGRIVSQPSLVAIGILSYSAYLIHQPILQAVGSQMMRRHFSAPVQAALVLCLLLPTLLALGYVYHLCFEKPFMSSSKKLDDHARAGQMRAEAST